ncbi:hypothetical protein SteCoe_702 [Stentor coeruleus]|uniref:GAR domain-containing protein n=1 Tax=Stentor coeruleus TaxID=5963 RepID=A0A1R2D3H5_9CILI|nr:hypothetical protein SteCoe_702 [Stentor coeruleus]
MVNSLSTTLISIFGAPTSSQIEQVISDQKSYLKPNEAVVTTFDLSPSFIIFNILTENNLIATGTLYIQNIPNSTAQTLWLRCKDALNTSRDIKIKITVLKNSTDNQNDECPYLTLLSSGKADDLISKRLEERLSRCEKKVMKINFEPDAPPRLGVEIKNYEAENLVDLDSGRLESIGGDQIKKQVKILSEEIKKIGLNPVQEHRNELRNQVRERVDQQENFEKYTENAVSDITKLISEMWRQEEQRTKIMQNIMEEENKIRENTIEIDTLKDQLSSLQKNTLMMKALRIRYRDLENLYENEGKFLEDSHKARNALNKKFEEAKNAANNARNEHGKLVEKLNKESEEYYEKLKSVSVNEKSLIENCQDLKNALSELKVKLADKSLADSPDVSLASNDRYTCISKLQSLQTEAFEHDQESKLKYKSAIDQKHTSYETLISLYRNLENQSQLCYSKHLENYLNSNELTFLEQSCCIQGDISNLTESLTKFLKFYSLSNKSALVYLNSTSSQILKETDNIKDQCNKINEIMNCVVEKDSETDRIKAVMGEIKLRHPPYIPKLDDPIDVALFEFIKSCEEPIPIPFTREEYGVYLFGTKRIFLKLENGNIVIRVGGGFTSIQNFIEIYTPIELQRQEEVVEDANPQFKSSQARFTQSPQKGMSPQRAARIIQGAVEVGVSGTPFKSLSPFRKTPNKK